MYPLSHPQTPSPLCSCMVGKLIFPRVFEINRLYLKKPSEENPESTGMVLPTIDCNGLFGVKWVVVESDEDDGDDDENIEPGLQSPVTKLKSTFVMRIEQE